jgi:hypothetical protein
LSINAEDRGFRFLGSNLAEDDGFSRVIKIHSMTSSEGK